VTAVALDPTTLLALLAGHLLGDFVLQPDVLAERKTRRTGWLVVHVLVVALVTWVLLGTVRAAPLVGALFAVHLLLDGVKRRFAPRAAERRAAGNPLAGADGGRYAAGGRALQDAARGYGWFVLDQALHAASLVALAWAAALWLPDLAAANAWTGRWGQDYAAALLLGAGFAATVWTLGVVLRFQMAGFAARLPDELVEGLPRGGLTVGQLERTLVFVFVLLGRPEAVAFVVAAKAGFRIGDLTRRDQRNHAEYIMLGTLRSFTYALLLALATRWLLTRIGG
jgi:hypothetical protein